MNFDLQIFFWLNELAGISRIVDIAIIFFADYVQYLLVLLFLIWIISSKKLADRRIEALRIGALSVIIARGIVTPLIRMFYQRPRPFLAYKVNQLVIDNAYSFPSGHSIFFFALSTAIFLYDKRMGVFFYVISALVGISRIIAGVHYPTDVLAGAFLGIVIAYIVAYTIKSAQSVRI